MASSAAIGKRREAAMKALSNTMAKIANVTGVAPVDLPTHSRDAALIPVLQLEALTTWAQEVAEALATAAEERVGKVKPKARKKKAE